MNEKWIGEENGTSGTYVQTAYPELSIRKGGYHDAAKLYRFENYVGVKYHITDPKVIANIETFLEKKELNELQQYLYELIIQKFGIIDFLSGVQKTMLEERKKYFHEGHEDKLQEIQNMLGIKN